MKTIAIITARGGSKRIPRKNIKEFCGKPILAYSIEAAIASGVFDEVMVSTDDDEIADIAKRYGAKVPFMRSEATANDYATTVDVLKEVLERYREMGQQFTKACCIYPTAPFVTGEKLRDAMKTLEEQDTFSVIPVVPFSFPPQRGLVIAQGNLTYVQPEHKNTRSQDLEHIYHDCGQFYCFDVEVLFRQGSLFGEGTKPLIMNPLEVQDIDNEEDWQIAEMKYRLMESRANRE
ncbi:MAG: pseudaminic acid cytidylyltransferase [Lachnospiraceae bacterium]|nr:pseudaminic acid cytidylyltransferase [Lachnospiraceae bacterium]